MVDVQTLPVKRIEDAKNQPGSDTSAKYLLLLLRAKMDSKTNTEIHQWLSSAVLIRTQLFLRYEKNRKCFPATMPIDFPSELPKFCIQNPQSEQQLSEFVDREGQGQGEDDGEDEGDGEAGDAGSNPP